MITERNGRGKAESAFTESEAEYLAENVLGRLATVSPSGQPHVVPVAYRFDGARIYFGGWNLERTLKYRNIAANNKVAFVVDEVVSTRPWRVRGVEVRGEARLHEEEGSVLVRIIPHAVRSWGLRVE